jgi:hypothetical protein
MHELIACRTGMRKGYSQGIYEVSLIEKVITAPLQILHESSALHCHTNASHETNVDYRGWKILGMTIVDKCV